MPAASTRLVNLHPTCESCVAKLKRELAAQQASLLELPLAITLGFVGAALGAAAWAAIVVFGNAEVGYVAMLVGYLAGQGVKLGAGKARGRQLQLLASFAAFFGLVAAKYLIVAHFMQQHGAAASWFDPRIVQAFPQTLRALLGGFDILWVLLAVSTAYGIPKAVRVSIEDHL